MDARHPVARLGDAADPNRLESIVLVTLAYLCFASIDATAKYLALSLATMQIVWMRYLSNVVFACLIFGTWREPRRYWPQNLKAQTLRAGFLAFATLCNFTAIRYLQLTETMAIFFLAPFIVAALAGPFLDEWAGARRWIAISIAFVGALIVIQPGPQGFQPAMILSFGATLGYAGYTLTTRRLAGSETPESLALYPSLFASVIFIPFGLSAWTLAPTPFQWVLLFAVGLFAAIGHLLFVRAHELAPAPVLAPFMYSQLIWMTGLGYLFFADIPRLTTGLGAAIIVLSGLYLFYRERKGGVG